MITSLNAKAREWEKDLHKCIRAIIERVQAGGSETARVSVQEAFLVREFTQSGPSVDPQAEFETHRTSLAGHPIEVVSKDGTTHSYEEWVLIQGSCPEIEP